MILNLVTAPTIEPITTAEAKTHLQVTLSSDDLYIDTLVAAARSYVENYTGRVLVTQTWDLFLDNFRSVIEIPKPPLSSVTSVKYTDGAGVQQTLATSIYTVDTNSTPGRVFRAYSQVWPTTQDIRNNVEIRFVAGYGNASTVPDLIKHAIKLMISHYYDQREPTAPIVISKVPLSIENILNQFVVQTFGAGYGS